MTAFEKDDKIPSGLMTSLCEFSRGRFLPDGGPLEDGVGREGAVVVAERTAVGALEVTGGLKLRRFIGSGLAIPRALWI